MPPTGPRHVASTRGQLWRDAFLTQRHLHRTSWLHVNGALCDGPMLLGGRRPRCSGIRRRLVALQTLQSRFLETRLKAIRSYTDADLIYI